MILLVLAIRGGGRWYIDANTLFKDYSNIPLEQIPNPPTNRFRNSPKAFGGDPGDAWVMRNQGMLWVLLDLYNHSSDSKIHTKYMTIPGSSR